MEHTIRHPTRVEDFDVAWLSPIFPDIESAQVADILHGTATKICIELVRSIGGEQRDHRVWIKTGMEPHNADKRLDNVYAGEVLYYTRLADRYETRTPHCYYAATDDEGRSVIVLDDLEAIGARFADPTEPASIDYAARALTSIARFHAASWGDPALAEIEWLRMGGSHRAYDFLSWLYDPNHWRDYCERPRFRHLPATLHKRDVMEGLHRRLQDVFWPAEPWALCHGDCHYGQTYELPGGEVRFLDWQGVQIAHWAHDLAYFLTGALSIEDRRSAEGDLLRHYLAALADFGVERPPNFPAAWKAYRANAFHGLGWVMCPVEMQSEENCSAFVERFAAAVTDLDTIAALQDPPY